MKNPSTNKLTRRNFLRRAALAAGALGLPARSWSQVPGANHDIRMAVVGFHGRGRDHIDAWSRMAGVRLTALCDVDRDVLDAGVKQCAAGGTTVEAYTDIRKLLESKNVDAVSIATPDHWHATAAIWAMQSGKDVYVEAPVSYDVWEGERMIDAARRHKKMVQAGMQSRSSPAIREAVEWVRQGHLGRIVVARAVCYQRQPGIGKTDGPQPVPASVDYDLWCGPAPMRPPRRKQFHYDWNWFWDCGAGALGEQGIHQADVAHWFLGVNSISYKVLSIGGRLACDDDAETPNTLISFHSFEHAPLIIEVRGLPDKTGSAQMDNYKGASVGVVIECDSGYVVVPDDRSATAFSSDGRKIKTFEGAGNHFENFIQAVRSRRESDLTAGIVEGHQSAVLCHMANISYRTGHGKSSAEMRAMINHENESLETFNRMAEHLAANGVNLGKSQATLGALLRVNPATAKIIQNKAANHLLRRVPRAGYAITAA